MSMKLNLLSNRKVKFFKYHTVHSGNCSSKAVINRKIEEAKEIVEII